MQEIFYESIEEIPLYNWAKINEGNLKFILLKIDTEVNELQLSEAWEKLYDDYIVKRGLSKHYQKLLTLMKQKTVLECDYIITGELFKLTEIEIQEEKLREMIQKDAVDISIEKTLIYLSKWIGYRLDWKVITLNEYYLILEEYGKAN
jgi:hypothetical protein